MQRITIRGKRSELGLGSPPAISLAMARKMALENRGKAMTGGDPLSERRAAREVLTFDAAIETYLAAKLEELRNEKHRKQWRSTLTTYASPVLAPVLVSAITLQDVRRVLGPIWSTKTETETTARSHRERAFLGNSGGTSDGRQPCTLEGQLIRNPAQTFQDFKG